MRAACQKTGGTTNLIFNKKSSKSTKAFALFSTDIPKDKTTTDPVKDYLPAPFTCSSTDADRLKTDTSTHDIVKNEANNKEQKLSTASNNASNITLLEKNIHELTDALEDLKEELPGPLTPCNEDISHLGPYTKPTYNFAKFANDSSTLQQLIKLGVQLYKLERHRDLVQMYLSLDFDRDIKPYIQFLYDCGVSSDNLGNFITRNPRIFKEDMDDLHTRIRYLRAHHFIPEMIKEIVNKNPLWLSFKTQDLDYRLGYFQNTFKLSGYQMRCMTVKYPKVITYNMQHIKELTFAVKEEMGFNLIEMQRVLLKAPRLWINARHKVLNSFDYAHNHMKLSHEFISLQPHILSCRRNRLQARHQFLVHLNRDQYDPLKPMYISPLTLISGNDLEFCKNVANASIDTYNMFLKTM